MSVQNCRKYDRINYVKFPEFERANNLNQKSDICRHMELLAKVVRPQVLLLYDLPGPFPLCRG